MKDVMGEMTDEQRYYGSSREDIIRFIPKDAKTILDVGCGLGLVSRAIKTTLGNGAEITGIEINPDVAEKAKGNIDSVIIGNAEMASLPFEKDYFDCIICGDVLEHLIDPWKTLSRYKEFLRDSGIIIASMPNVCYYKIIRMLKKQEWEYQDSGIMDRSHLRFFTLKSIKEMFGSAGLEIKKIERIIKACKEKKILNKILFNALEEYLTFQYIVIARKK